MIDWECQNDAAVWCWNISLGDIKNTTHMEELDLNIFEIWNTYRRLYLGGKGNVFRKERNYLYFSIRGKKIMNKPNYSDT